jgi:hypothetical protein
MRISRNRVRHEVAAGMTLARTAYHFCNQFRFYPAVRKFASVMPEAVIG